MPQKFVVRVIGYRVFFEACLISLVSYGAYWMIDLMFVRQEAYNHSESYIIAFMRNEIFAWAVLGFFLLSSMYLTFRFVVDFLIKRKPYFIISKEGLWTVFCKNHEILKWDELINLQLRKNKFPFWFFGLFDHYVLIITVNDKRKLKLSFLPSRRELGLFLIDKSIEDIVTHIKKYKHITA